MTASGATPLISVVVPVFNGGDYLGQALDSVLAQSFPDFEIVLVNDGSRDEGRTDNVCRRYAEAHASRITYIAQPNGGVGAALNSAVAAMRGEVFCWLSHDDLFEPNKLERQVDYSSRLKTADAMLFSDYALIDAHGRETAQVRLDHAEALRAPRLPLFRGWVNGCTLFIPKRLFPSDAPFEPQYRHVQDYRLWLDLLDRAELFHQPEVLVRYRVHAGQDSRKPEATLEGDALWIDMTDWLGPAARAQISGSDRRFYEEMRAHLDLSNYPAAAAHAAALRDRSPPDDAPQPLPGADLQRRLESLRAEVQERLRFVSDPRFWAADAETLPLTEGTLHVEHPGEPADDGAVGLRTGEQPWALVASMLIELAPTTTLLEVRSAAGEEEVYALLVDEAYVELASRVRVTDGVPIWFETDRLPKRVRLVLQAGEAPLDRLVRLLTVRALSPSAVLQPALGSSALHPPVE